jgi:hypothetical protein
MHVDTLLFPSQCEQACAVSHYVNLLTLQSDQEHTAWQWLDAAQAETDEAVRPCTRVYAGCPDSAGGSWRRSFHFLSESLVWGRNEWRACARWCACVVSVVC